MENFTEIDNSFGNLTGDSLNRNSLFDCILNLYKEIRARLFRTSKVSNEAKVIPSTKEASSLHSTELDSSLFNEPINYACSKLYSDCGSVGGFGVEILRE